MMLARTVCCALVLVAACSAPARSERTTVENSAPSPATESVATPDAGLRGFSVQLPPAASADPIDAGDRILVITILDTGEAILDNQKLTDESLARAFVHAAGIDPDTKVVIRAHERATHGRVVEIMELAKQAGLTKLAIATRDTK